MQTRASYHNTTGAILCIRTLVIQQRYTMHILLINSRYLLRILRHPQFLRRGHAMEQFIEAQRYDPEGRGFDY